MVSFKELLLLPDNSISAKGVSPPSPNMFLYVCTGEDGLSNSTSTLASKPPLKFLVLGMRSILTASAVNPLSFILKFSVESLRNYWLQRV